MIQRISALILFHGYFLVSCRSTPKSRKEKIIGASPILCIVTVKQLRVGGTQITNSRNPSRYCRSVPPTQRSCSELIEHGRLTSRCWEPWDARCTRYHEPPHVGAQALVSCRRPGPAGMTEAGLLASKATAERIGVVRSDAESPV